MLDLCTCDEYRRIYVLHHRSLHVNELNVCMMCSAGFEARPVGTVTGSCVCHFVHVHGCAAGVALARGAFASLSFVSSR